jgi:hypothetical protein
MIVVPQVAKRVFPALRDPAPVIPAAAPAQELQETQEMPAAEAVQPLSTPPATVPPAKSWTRPAERAATHADRLVAKAAARSHSRARAKRR